MCIAMEQEEFGKTRAKRTTAERTPAGKTRRKNSEIKSAPCVSIDSFPTLSLAAIPSSVLSLLYKSHGGDEIIVHLVTL